MEENHSTEKKWNKLYALVIVAHILVLSLLYYFTQHYS